MTKLMIKFEKFKKELLDKTKTSLQILELFSNFEKNFLKIINNNKSECKKFLKEIQLKSSLDDCDKLILQELHFNMNKNIKTKNGDISIPIHQREIVKIGKFKFKYYVFLEKEVVTSIQWFCHICMKIFSRNIEEINKKEIVPKIKEHFQETHKELKIY